MRLCLSSRTRSQLHASTLHAIQFSNRRPMKHWTSRKKGNIFVPLLSKFVGGVSSMRAPFACASLRHFTRERCGKDHLQISGATWRFRTAGSAVCSVGVCISVFLRCIVNADVSTSSESGSPEGHLYLFHGPEYVSTRARCIQHDQPPIFPSYGPDFEPSPRVILGSYCCSASLPDVAYHGALPLRCPGTSSTLSVASTGRFLVWKKSERAGMRPRTALMPSCLGFLHEPFHHVYTGLISSFQIRIRQYIYVVC
jgi:hypothetical protein